MEPAAAVHNIILLLSNKNLLTLHDDDVTECVREQVVKREKKTKMCHIAPPDGVLGLFGGKKKKVLALYKRHKRLRYTLSRAGTVYFFNKRV